MGVSDCTIRRVPIDAAFGLDDRQAARRENLMHLYD